MILWTIQHAESWAKGKRARVLRADGRRVWHSFRASHAWMAAEMVRRIGHPPRQLRYPIWAWHQYEGTSRGRPDLRCSGHLAPGSEGVLIEFDIAPELVLLSDFDLWHYVLNRWYLPRDIREAKELDQLPHYEHPNAGRMKKSWQRIFELNWSAKDIALPRHRKRIQATLWQVPLENVRTARRFRAR